MQSEKIKLGIVGVGKIVRDQHLPSIYRNKNYELVAVASKSSSLQTVNSYSSIEEMLAATPQLQAVSLCMPPQGRYEVARFALNHGLHVLLEKPPAATVAEIDRLATLAAEKNLSMFATWHSRHAAAVAKTKSIIAEEDVLAIKVAWKENVKKWHENQEWIWQADSLGVFDAGINGLSILTHIVPDPVELSGAKLFYPENKQAPIAAELSMHSSSIPIQASFDWRCDDNELWQIEIKTQKGNYVLSEGGASLSLNGVRVTDVAQQTEYSEYQSIYAHFETLVANAESDVDATPLSLTERAFLIGEQIPDLAFNF